MAKKTLPEEVARPITIAVVVIMFVAVVAIQFINKVGNAPEQEPVEEFSVAELIDQIVPPPDAFDNLLSEQISEEELRSEAVTIFTRDSEVRDVIVTKPQGSGPFNAMVLIHGDRSSRRQTEDFSRDYGQQLTDDLGVMTVSVDWRDSDYAEGDLTDVLSTIDWLESSVNLAQPPMLIGEDHGAYLALLVAEEVDATGVVFVSGLPSPLQQFIALQTQDETKATAFLKQSGCDRSSEPESCLLDLSALGSIEENVLVVYNTRDSVVESEQAQLLLQHLPETQRTELRIDSAELPHSFLTNEAEPAADARQTIREWIQNQLSQQQ